MRIYDFFFYVFFSIFKLLSSGWRSNTFSCWLISIFIFSVILVVNIVLFFPKVNNAHYILISILFFNCLVYFYKNRYLKVIDYFNNYKNKDLIFYGTFIFVLYIITIVIYVMFYFPIRQRL